MSIPKGVTIVPRPSTSSSSTSSALASGQQSRRELEDKRLEKELHDLTHVTESGEQFCYFMTQELLRHTLQNIEDKYYDEKSVPFAVSAVMSQMKNVLDYLFVDRDGGELSSRCEEAKNGMRSESRSSDIVTINSKLLRHTRDVNGVDRVCDDIVGDNGDDNDDSLSCWNVDSEPERIPTDSWSRNSIPIIYRKRASSQRNMHGSASSSRVPSPSQSPPSTSQRSRPLVTKDGEPIVLSMSAIEKQHKKSAVNNTNNSNKTKQQRSSSKDERGDHSPDTARSITSSTMGSTVSELPGSTPSEAGKDSSSKGSSKHPSRASTALKLTQTSSGRRTSKSGSTGPESASTRRKSSLDPHQVKVMQEKKWETLKRKEDEEEKRRIEKVLSQTRGLDYTYSKNGEIILIKPVDPNRLPAIHVKMKYSIAGSGSSGDNLSSCTDDDLDGEEGGNAPKNQPTLESLGKANSKTVVAESNSKTKVTREEKKPGASSKKTTAAAADKMKDLMEYVTTVTPSQPMIERLKPVKGVVIKVPNKPR